MRRIGVLCLLIAACSSTTSHDDPYRCPVWEVADSPTDGLVKVPQPLFGALEALIPGRRFQSEHVCWYVKPSGHLEAFPWDGAYDVGFEFESTDEGWKFLKRNEYVYLTHKRVR